MGPGGVGNGSVNGSGRRAAWGLGESGGERHGAWGSWDVNGSGKDNGMGNLGESGTVRWWSGLRLRE